MYFRAYTRDCNCNAAISQRNRVVTLTNFRNIAAIRWRYRSDIIPSTPTLKHICDTALRQFHDKKERERPRADARPIILRHNSVRLGPSSRIGGPSSRIDGPSSRIGGQTAALTGSSPFSSFSSGSIVSAGTPGVGVGTLGVTNGVGISAVDTGGGVGW